MRASSIVWIVVTALGCGDSGTAADDTSGSSSTVGPGTGSTVEPDTGSTGSGTLASTTGRDTTASSESSDTDQPSLDEQLAELLEMQEVPVVPLEPPAAQDPAMVALGEALFFDPILSGNKDTACASCHHPSWAASDGLSLTLGTGAVGVGPERGEGAHPPFVPRHSQSLFNVGDESFARMFWDGRVERLPDDSLRTPAGAQLLPGVASPLAAQAMFPILDRAEMRGQIGELTVLGEPNELADLDDDDFQGMWAALMARIGAVQGYQDLFSAAYPGQDFADLTFAHAANAIAAYESEAFSFPNTPWDDYLRGDLAAISAAAKVGAILFYGSAQCSNCHVGALLTDHDFHSTGVPQLGPGKVGSAPFDYGRELVTGDAADRYHFRTPSLRNVEVSAPYMHSGAHLDFQTVVVHYGDVIAAIADYDPSGLHPDLIDTVQQDAGHLAEITASLSEELNLEPTLAGLSNIRQFLLVLTDPDVFDLPSSRPASVPSGLDVP